MSLLLHGDTVKKFKLIFLIVFKKLKLNVFFKVKQLISVKSQKHILKISYSALTNRESPGVRCSEPTGGVPSARVFMSFMVCVVLNHFYSFTAQAGRCGWVEEGEIVITDLTSLTDNKKERSRCKALHKAHAVGCICIICLWLRINTLIGYKSTHFFVT